MIDDRSFMSAKLGCVHGGMHTLVAARVTADRFKKGEIDKELYDAKWELPPCKIYIFKQHQKEIKDLVHALGEEDNFDYKMVTLTFFSFFLEYPLL